MASYSYNAAGERTSLQYKKGESTWFSDSVSPSSLGQWLSQESSLSAETYTYDSAGRLTQVQDTPKGKGCITRSYGYDEETNRLSLASYPPTSEGKCQSSEGAAVENHAYDEADRLIDNGTTYNTFGDIEKTSAQDAGGPEGGQELVSSFFADGQLHEQSQKVKSGEVLKLQTVGYKLDPAMRNSLITSTGPTTATEEQHYASPGSTPAWTSELSGQYTRTVSGISGGLVAVQHGSEEPILQLEEPPRRHRRDRVPLGIRNQTRLRSRHHRVRRPRDRSPTEVLLAWLPDPDRATLRHDRHGRPLVCAAARPVPAARPRPRRLCQRLRLHLRQPSQRIRSERDPNRRSTENQIAGAELMAGNVAREIALEEAARREAEAKARIVFTILFILFHGFIFTLCVGVRFVSIIKNRHRYDQL